MERAILLLIRDDIKFIQQNNVLLSIGWNAETLSTNNLKVISLLLDFKLTDELMDQYYSMVENSDKEEIYLFLIGFK